MDKKQFKRKKFMPLDVQPKFPRVINDKSYIGVFDGQSVSIFEKSSIFNIYNGGNFGKGSLSKSAPTHNTGEDDVPRIIMQQQWENQLKWSSCPIVETSGNNDSTIFIESIQSFLNSTFSRNTHNSWKEWKAQNMCESEMNNVAGIIAGNRNETIQDNSTTEYYTLKDDITSSDHLKNMVEEILLTRKIREPKMKESNTAKLVLVAENTCQIEMSDSINLPAVKVELRNNLQNLKEILKLSLPETFFLCFALGCLKVLSKSGNEMNVKDLWTNFCQSDENFISKYIAYHQYRAYGWTVRSGLKFGGDYLLYKIGPAYYHASYLVWLLDKKKRRMEWKEFVALNRLMETCNKDLLLCEIFEPVITSVNYLASPDVMREFSVLEMLSKRWIPSQEREFGKKVKCNVNAKEETNSAQCYLTD